LHKSVAIQLQKKAEDIAKMYSIKERECNFNNETFFVLEIVPLSAITAIVVFMKNTGKKGMAHLIYVKDKWIYYFPRSEHFLNLDKLVDKYTEIEQFNYPLNFEEEHENGQT